MTAIKLPPAFEFSQSSLQDFVDCPRRFQLRHLLNQEWPAPAAEPLDEAESAAEAGRRFHLLMERHWRGIPIRTETLDPVLRGWWEAFQTNSPPLPGPIRRPEVRVSAWLNLAGGQRFTAAYDLLAYAPGERAVILDYKTTKHTRRSILDRRLQTVIYPLLLVEAAPTLLGERLAPEQISLVYWFAADGGTVEEFPYSEPRYADDKRFVGNILSRLFSLNVAEWPLTSEEKRCKLCQYRSLCDRGRYAGALDDGDPDSWPDIEELRGLIAEAANADDFVL
jgi:CRISPR/Cas system-associated exonuclease Cas4 (RecB family)